MKKLSLILSMVLLLPIIACNEEDLDLVNPNELSAETFYSTEAQAVTAVNAIYANLQSGGLWRREYFFTHDLLSDEVFGLGSLEGQRVALWNRSFDATNSLVGAFWNDAYRGIQRANLVLDNVGNTEREIAGLSDALRNRLLAEARFLRALMYFELVSMWGDVPLYTSVSTVVEGIPRSPAADVYQVIIDDLDFAQSNLPDNYSADDAGRATKGAAYALEGRVWLFRAGAENNAEFYNNAKSAYQDFENNTSGYALVDTYLDNFLEETEHNIESIFEVNFTLAFGGGNRWSGDGNGINEVTFRGQEYGMRAWRNVVPSEALLGAFEDDDVRFGASFYSPCDLYNNDTDTVYTPNDCPAPAGASNTTPDDLPSWKKYQNYYKLEQEVNQQSGINFRVIRYAEILLSHAEAIAETEGVTADAVDKVNQIRTRAGLSEFTVGDFGSADDFIDAIMQERRVEFAGEQIRYRDLLRRDLLQETVGAVHPQLSLPKHALLPVPQGEIDNNINISEADQNSGY
ncbi:MAG: RagB/SusD family nutrient uptake outer membrane protein [Bacteroidota bacterium]